MTAGLCPGCGAPWSPESAGLPCPACTAVLPARHPLLCPECGTVDAHRCEGSAVEAMREIRDDLGLAPDATYAETVEGLREWLAALNRRIDNDAGHVEEMTAMYADAYSTAERAMAAGLSECERLRAERDLFDEWASELLASRDGRAIAPTDAEITAHAAAGGTWRRRVDATGQGMGGMGSATARMVRDRDGTLPGRWWAEDATGRPCPWPL